VRKKEEKAKEGKDLKYVGGKAEVGGEVTGTRPIRLSQYSLAVLPVTALTSGQHLAVFYSYWPVMIADK
jgi:hypothetical protein